MRGRGVTLLWQSDPLAGPPVRDAIAMRCEDTNGWRPSTSCGSDDDNSGWHTDAWPADMTTYLGDNSDCYFHWLYAFYSSGNPNPRTSSGAYYVEPWRTGKVKCRSGYKDGACQFRE